MNSSIKRALDNWFTAPGAYVLVDGQFGSTGKGLIAAALAECFWNRVDVVISNAGPNSGHTSYYNNEKIVLKQLPTFSVIAKMRSEVEYSLTHLSAGAVVDTALLKKECLQYGIESITVHPNAALVTPMDREIDKENVFNIASTGQGVGPALIRKLHRVPLGIFGNGTFPDPDIACQRMPPFHSFRCFLEIPQGFSLGINSRFYPNVTTRECSVSQALADAGMPPSFHRKTIMAVRTFPIRVGNTEHSSGGYYPDQVEIDWTGLRVQPETTTVTGRIRRVFTWSKQQYRDSLEALAPDVVFLNFCNYLSLNELRQFVKNNVFWPYREVLGRDPEAILLGHSAQGDAITVWED